MGGIGIRCSVFFDQSREFLPLSTSVLSCPLFLCFRPVAQRPSRYSVGNGDVSTAVVCGCECSVYLSKCLCNCFKSRAPVSPSFLFSRVFGMVALRIFMKMIGCVCEKIVCEMWQNAGYCAPRKQNMSCSCVMWQNKCYWKVTKFCEMQQHVCEMWWDVCEMW